MANNITGGFLNANEQKWIIEKGLTLTHTHKKNVQRIPENILVLTCYNTYCGDCLEMEEEKNKLK